MLALRYALSGLLVTAIGACSETTSDTSSPTGAPDLIIIDADVRTVDPAAPSAVRRACPMTTAC